ncbi:MAG: hypothetical protein VKL39_03595 [Leptolyngbyaceae bacterium]|nr:hypothetical protein [Leptolyngbyaceae bacterium]
MKKHLFVWGVIPVLLMGSTFPDPPRPLNPLPQETESESDLDRYFRLAFDAALGGDFDTAIDNYEQALDEASNECDRQHAQAGIQAATEVRERQQGQGQNDFLAQEFWFRLQELALPLPCTTLL